MIMTAKYYEAPPQNIEHLYDEVDGVWTLKDELSVMELSDTETTGIVEHHHNARHETRDDAINNLINQNRMMEAKEAIDDLNKMPVGDVNSDEKGTGARALGPNKVPMQWVPVRFWLDLFRREAHALQREMPAECVGHLLSCVLALQEFTEGRGTGQEMAAQLGPDLMEQAANVFQYGANKYKAWNWLKGMPWSIPVGCALRHMQAVFIDQELLDSESLEPHTGHFACNIIMLATYDVMYQEGNDLPPEGLWK